MIRNRQIAHTLSDIIQDTLKAGKIPSYDLVIKELHRRLPVEGIPYFNPTLIEKYSVSNPIEINNMFTAMQNDIIIALDENNYQFGKLLALLNYYETERYKILATIDELFTRIENIKEYQNIIKNNGKIIIEQFVNFDNIDFIGEGDLHKTDVFVDLRQHKTHNWRKRKRINIQNMLYTITADTAVTKNRELYQFANCLSDVVSETWMTEIESKLITSSITLNITLNDVQQANSIIFTSNSERDIEIDLYLSEDKQTYTKQSRSIMGKISEWNFDTKNIAGIKFVITKNEPDGVNDTSYMYYFGAENIAMYKDVYEQEGILLSKPYTVDEMKQVTLKTKEVKYPKTKITYYILVNNNGVIEWNQIFPDNEPLALPYNNFTGDIRLMAILKNNERSPQLLEYQLLFEGA